MQLLSAMSPKGKAMLAACALGFVVVAFLLVKMASAPAYTEIATGLDPKKTGEVTAALDEAAIAYEVKGNGTTVAVDKAQSAQARIALATAGLDTTEDRKPGYELLDEQKLGTSQQQQQVAYQRALEGEIASTIGKIDGVGSASVALTLPKEDLFADESEAATAAVMLGSEAGQLDGAAVKGIANLVASSVQGLKTEKVTITDSAGAMLWPQGDGAGGSSASKPAAEARYDQQLEAQLTAMLATTLGPGKAQVQVRSDLNVDQATEEKLEYAEKGVPLKRTEETETLRGTGAVGAGAAAGTATNIPSYANGTGGGTGSSSNYRKSSTSEDLGVNKTVTRRTIAPGQVNRLGVSVLVDAAAKPDVAALEAAIGAAAGIDAQRGDTIEVRSMAFAKAEAPAPAAAGPVPAGVMGLVKPIGLGLAAALFLFFLTRGLKKRQTGAFADEPSWLKQLEAPRIAAAIGSGGGGDEPTQRLDEFDPQAAAREVFKNDPRALALEDLVAREPEKVAHQLRTWITDEKEQ